MPITVSQVNTYLKSLVDSDMVLNSLDVVGEVSNFKEYSASGQWYFTLKDAESQISCVVFTGVAGKMKHRPADGERIVVKGKLTVFNKRGTYNLQVFWLEQEGLGDLAKEFEKLKKKLSAEGLFDTARKKKMPEHPQKIAILAAREGAAVHDVIRVATRRDPGVQLFVVPTVVQGKAAVTDIVRKLELISGYPGIDIIILARGGGSLEDLWAFNTEQVARAIASCSVPTVSAIGHEVDFTIADFVADLRAPTPSAAAELVVPEREKLREWLEAQRSFLMRGLQALVVDQYQSLAYYEERLREGIRRVYEKQSSVMQQLIGQLEALNPLKVLQRGYAVVEKETKLITSIKSIQLQDELSLTFADGQAKVLVNQKSETVDI
jgi:exodeoxyribonuclease VII large subunit